MTFLYSDLHTFLSEQHTSSSSSSSVTLFPPTAYDSLNFATCFNSVQVLNPTQTSGPEQNHQDVLQAADAAVLVSDLSNVPPDTTRLVLHIKHKVPPPSTDGP
jgi:hypothetical protein